MSKTCNNLKPEKDSIIIYQLRDARWMDKEVMGIDKTPPPTYCKQVFRKNIHLEDAVDLRQVQVLCGQITRDF